MDRSRPGRKTLVRYFNPLGVAFCLVFAGCSQAALMKRFTPPEDEAIARKYVDLLRQEKFEQIDVDLDPSLIDSNLRDTLAKMAGMFPPDSPKSAKVVGAHAFRGPEFSRINITLEYEFPSSWLLVDITTQRKGDVFTIVGFHVNPISDSLENLNKFTLIGKGITQYGVLGMAIFATLCSLYVFVLCLRTKNVKKKWLWAIFILVGVGKLAVNWTTGHWGFQFVTLQIPCGSAAAPLYGPWTVAVSLPLGAILFLLRDRKNDVHIESNESSTVAPPESLSPPGRSSA
jgi:hypothetical protein